MLFKCKICGGSLNVSQGERVTECEYCGVKQTIPAFIEPKTQEIYNRANSYLMNNEFDKAENLYNQILFENKEDADAYWNVLMCQYGVTYVKDPASGKYIPTCNRTLYASILNDENYQKALKHADEKQKALYVENAKIIDNIQKGILEVSKKEKPFDIFISYKETDANGARTNDSIVAQDLYNKLTSAGYKVFFSRITLEKKIGSEYEPYIYAALASSKVMITVSSSKENIDAVWVKNEWSRYLSFAAKDSSKTIIPLYYNMDKFELPEEFAHLSAYDMKANGFEQELIRGIKKLIPTPVVLQERRKKRNKILKRVSVVAVIGIIIGIICAVPWLQKLPEYNAAMQLYYDKNYPEATWAFNALGSYRDSNEMKEKCADSWRKNVSTVATYNSLGSTSAGSYYVTPNGTVETFSFNPGVAADEIDINEHGKVVSIGDNYPLYALYEDGYVFNSAKNNELDKNWENIIQISPVFNATSVALRDDGTLVYGDLQNDYNEDVVDTWLTPVSQWQDIVSFDYCVYRFGTGGVIEAALVGIKSDGTLCAVHYETEDNVTVPIDYSYDLSQFNDVKSIDILIREVENNDRNRFRANYLNIIAVTNHNTVQTYINGEFNEYSVENINKALFQVEYRDRNSYLEIYYLYNDGKIKKKDKDIVILEDVIYANDGFLITRSGSIYTNYPKLEKTEGKTRIHNEWIERMN